MDGPEGSECGAKKKSSVIRPLNNYNIFFTLERRLIMERRKQDSLAHQASPDETARTSAASDSASDIIAVDVDAPLTGYEDLELPPLPPRFQHLAPSLPRNWFIPGRNVSVKHKRKHTATHGREFSLLYWYAALVWSNYCAKASSTGCLCCRCSGLLQRARQDRRGELAVHRSPHQGLRRNRSEDAEGSLR